ncbi:hypothetical protein L3X38_008003 [Prunus dulcis]|uniref:Uncharacterized protein n=1 Tax=Prunus dulcis TaxID=3755 RepID=A0AAD4ZVP6_PRUDU|nr:hypothetical protein L3X38_008003 [Prunus dulcis]
MSVLSVVSSMVVVVCLLAFKVAGLVIGILHSSFPHYVSLKCWKQKPQGGTGVFCGLGLYASGCCLGLLRLG